MRSIQAIQAIPTLFLIFMGSMDCLTTVIGSLYYCTSELNPLLSGLVSSNIWGFIFVKLSVTVFVALMFILAQKNAHEVSEQKLGILQDCAVGAESCLF